MRFGVFYELQLPRPWNEGDEHRLFSEALEQIVLADRLGFDFAWEVEHHFLDEYSHSSAPEVFLAAAAGLTKSIRLGHGIRQVIPNYNHPARTAEGLATLDLLSNGRVEFGIGEGATRLELHAFGIPAREKRAMALEAAEQVCNMMVLTPYPGFEGNSFSMPCRNVLPKPLQKPHPPIWVGGHTSPAIRRAAEFGDGWMPIGLRPPAILEPEELGDKITRLRDLTVKSGRPADAVALCFSTDVVFEENPPVNRRMMSGLPEQVAADLRQYQDLGVSNFIISFPSDTSEGQRTAMERFSREVMPLIPSDI